MAGISRCLQKSTRRPWKDSTSTLPKPAVTSRISSIRSSTVNSPCLDWLIITATCTTSYSFEARPMMSRCPLVMGSKDPGQTARRTVIPSLSGPVIVRLRT